MTRLNIVVGITGGIAAYKAVGVIRGLVLAGHDVHVVATASAFQFVGRATLEAISRNLVHSELYDGVAEVRHVAIGQAADLIVVAPATANTISKIATGLADDLLGTTILASTAPLVIAPAMHTEMWQNPSTIANIQLLRSRGVTIVGPAIGQLTGADSGPGRMVEPDEIIAAALARVSPRDLAGRRILVSAGGTREPLDPVRFFGNRSSGRQGVAIAVAAAQRGADVTLVSCNVDVSVSVSVSVPGALRVLHASTARELAAAMSAEAESADIIVMAAAVADYRPVTTANVKISKESHGERLTIELVQNPDILASLTAAAPPHQLIVGFAAETEPDDAALLESGRRKLARKGCDYLVVNRVGWDTGFSVPDNTVMMLDRAGDIVMEAAGSKSSVADRILDLLV